MEAGIADHVWLIEEVVSLLVRSAKPPERNLSAI
jgi:hypothetical protein